MVLEKLDIHMREVKDLNPYLTLYTKPNLSPIIGWNIRAKIIKLLEVLGEYFCDPWIGREFLGRIQKV